MWNNGVYQQQQTTKKDASCHEWVKSGGCCESFVQLATVGQARQIVQDDGCNYVVGKPIYCSNWGVPLCSKQQAEVYPVTNTLKTTGE